MLGAFCSGFMVNFIIGSGGNDDDFHCSILVFQFIYNANAVFQKFYFKESCEICSVLASKRSAVTAFLLGNRILPDYLDALDDGLTY